MSSKTRFQRLTTALAAGLVAATFGAPHAAQAQNLFAPVAQVDEALITEFEVQQRIRFLQVLGARGGSRGEVIDELINDRLRLAETARVGITLPDEDLQNGLSEFAARAELTTDELVQGLESAGVARETLRDFVTSSLIWRDYIRARFGSRVQISDREIDLAIASVRPNSGIEVLLSEIIIPAPPPRAEQVLAQAEQIAQSQSEAEFSGFARRFSATASRGNGGRLPWTEISQLPPALRPLLLALTPGEVTAPLPIPNAVALFQLRDIRETDAPAPEYAAIEYAAYYIPGGRTPEALARARAISARVDRCDDLYGVAQGQPENVLDRGSLPPSEIPDDIAIELSKLDPGETSTALTRASGNTLVLLMLCGRTPELGEDQEIDRDSVASQLRNQRLGAFAENLLEQLRAEATIRTFE
ncbi:peptidylprolyl isomerase [uncultured Tateyamaria sp.]|uniref:peptidylprolyl isomerase n=1 Tax=uncultured Tateyamaria sp. TaxID=455651 RepID=UPI0026200D8E|nr:peptidylprolyl isomerase [uncultured Tateyamaria sp.]